MAMTTAKEQLSDYKYVDAYHCDRRGKHSQWQRISVDEITKYREACGGFNCFSTVQLFTSPEQSKGEPQSHLAPLYFDLDYADDPTVSQQDAKKLIEFFTKELDVKTSDISVFFSGGKGFHILIDYPVFGIEPRKDLCKIFKHIAGYLIHRLELKALDLAVYTIPRMLRMVNSLHAASRLYKIALTIEELNNLCLDEIKTLAQTPRNLPEHGGKAPALRTKAAHLFADKREEYLQAAATANERYAKDEYRFNKNTPPECVKDILANGWKKDGDRNQATVQLGAYFKDAGYTKDEAADLLEDWVKRFTSAKSSYQIKQRVANTRSVVDTVYSHDNEYRFGCNFIRSLHGKRTPGSKDYERVKCAGDLCHCLVTAINEEEVLFRPLNLTGDSELTGKVVRTRVMVVGKRSTPYIVPKRMEFSCWGFKNCKKTYCPLYDTMTHIGYKELGAHDRALVQMVGVNDDQLKRVLRNLSGVPDCQKYDLDIAENTNVEELLVIPMAEEGSGGVVVNEDKKQDNSRYVLRKVYTTGHISLTENRYYEITGYVWPHPKNQESTIVIRSARPLQDVIESFQATPEIKAELAAIFRPADFSGAAIQQKLNEIVDDLTFNVTGRVQREVMHLAVLLVQHSVLRFRVPWDSDPIRGWLECKIIGDTGTAKSTLLEKLFKYCGLGTMVNAESTTRTGLTYKMEQSGSSGTWYLVWGAWPLSDRELIWIDEDTGLPRDEYGAMTQARSSGIMSVKRAVTAETPCRVRAILSGNAPDGKRLGDYAHGCEALTEVFKNEDIRRFDFALFLRGNIPSSVYNAPLPIYPHKITAQAYKNNILFAWSRNPEQVEFSLDALTALRQTSEKLSDLYGRANKVPIVSPSDQRNKMARLSVALAALTQSTDETGEKVIVHPGHVEFIFHYLNALYRDPACGLNQYAASLPTEEALTDEKFDKLTKQMKQLDILKGTYKFVTCLKVWKQNNYLNANTIEGLLGLDKPEVRALTCLLNTLGLIKTSTGGFAKTSKFNSYLSEAYTRGWLAEEE